MKILTWSDFDQFSPCYDPREKYGEFEGTMLDILNDSRIPAEDKIWAFTRGVQWDDEKERDKKLRLFACACVREVWHLLTDERSKNAVIVAEKFANGEATEDELKAAGDAAWAAALEARGTAWAAAWAAALEAAAAARAGTAVTAARERQIEIAKTFLT